MVWVKKDSSTNEFINPFNDKNVRLKYQFEWDNSNGQYTNEKRPAENKQSIFVKLYQTGILTNDTNDVTCAALGKNATYFFGHYTTDRLKMFTDAIPKSHIFFDEHTKQLVDAKVVTQYPGTITKRQLPEQQQKTKTATVTSSRSRLLPPLIPLACIQTCSLNLTGLGDVEHTDSSFKWPTTAHSDNWFSNVGNPAYVVPLMKKLYFQHDTYSEHQLKTLQHTSIIDAYTSEHDTMIRATHKIMLHANNIKNDLTYYMLNMCRVGDERMAACLPSPISFSHAIQPHERTIDGNRMLTIEKIFEQQQCKIEVEMATVDGKRNSAAMSYIGSMFAHAASKRSTATNSSLFTETIDYRQVIHDTMLSTAPLHQQIKFKLAIDQWLHNEKTKHAFDGIFTSLKDVILQSTHQASDVNANKRQRGARSSLSSSSSSSSSSRVSILNELQNSKLITTEDDFSWGTMRAQLNALKHKTLETDAMVNVPLPATNLHFEMYFIGSINLPSTLVKETMDIQYHALRIANAFFNNIDAYTASEKDAKNTWIQGMKHEIVQPHDLSIDTFLSSAWDFLQQVQHIRTIRLTDAYDDTDDANVSQSKITSVMQENWNAWFDARIRDIRLLFTEPNRTLYNLYELSNMHMRNLVLVVQKWNTGPISARDMRSCQSAIFFNRLKTCNILIPCVAATAAVVDNMENEITQIQTQHQALAGTYAHIYGEEYALSSPAVRDTMNNLVRLPNDEQKESHSEYDLYRRACEISKSTLDDCFLLFLRQM